MEHFCSVNKYPTFHNKQDIINKFSMDTKHLTNLKYNQFSYYQQNAFETLNEHDNPNSTKIKGYRSTLPALISNLSQLVRFKKNFICQES